MKRLYSRATQTTYIPGLHASIPSDAVEISDELYSAVIGNPPDGKAREHDRNGLPYLVDAPPPVADAAAIERQWRDSELSGVMWLRERHRDQLEISAPTSVTNEQFEQLLIFMQELRDWPQSASFPDRKHRPESPDWIAGQVR